MTEKKSVPVTTREEASADVSMLCLWGSSNGMEHTVVVRVYSSQQNFGKGQVYLSTYRGICTWPSPIYRATIPFLFLRFGPYYEVDCLRKLHCTFKKCTYFGLASLFHVIFSNNVLACISSVDWWKEKPSWKDNSPFAANKTT